MRTIIIRSFVFLVVCIFACGAPFVITAGSAAEKEPIKLGHVYVMSGGAAMYGKNSAAATQIAIDEINKAGGVLGRPLEVIFRDTKLSPDVGVREAKNLVLNEKVFMLTGSLSSGVALAISAYAKEQKILYFNSMAHTPKLTNEEGHRYFFRWSTNSTTQHKSGAQAAAKHWGHKKVVIVAPDYEYGKSFQRIFWKFYPQYVPGAKVVSEIWIPLGTKDFTPYITKLMGLDTELVASALYGGMQLAFGKQAKPFGLYDKFHFYGASDADTYALYPMKPGDPGSKGSLSTDRYPSWMGINAKSDAFVKKFREKTGRIPEFGSACQYISMHALADAIEEAGSLDTEKIIVALEGKVFDTLLGKIEMRACDHQFQTPLWIGIMGHTPDYQNLHITQRDKFDNPYVNYDTCEEVMALRKK